MGPGRYFSWDYSGVFATASDVGGEGKKSGMTPRGGGRASKKGQAWSVQTRFGETSLTTKKKPRKHQCFSSLLICAMMSDTQVLCSAPNARQKPPLAGATIRCRVPVLSPGASSKVRLQSSPSLPEPTLRHVSCPARLTLHAVVMWVAWLPSMTGASWWGCWGRPSVLGMCLQNASGHLPPSAPMHTTARGLTHGAPGQQPLQLHGKLVVGVDLHPLGPHSAKHNLMDSPNTGLHLFSPQGSIQKVG